MSDPSISSVVWEEQKISRHNNNGNVLQTVNKSCLEEVVCQGPESLDAVMASAATKEDWVHVTESATNLLHKNLPYVQDKKGLSLINILNFVQLEFLFCKVP